jgi:acyl-coenzyme A synthetase/AMP-(fatty) acid ligase
VKVSPAEIDYLVQSYEGILDAATFGFEDHQGLEDICAAVVVTEDFKMECFEDTWPKRSLFIDTQR